jgi:glycogen(starch) synthase
MINGGPRRILMTADAVGGVWTYALELARALAPHGIEVALATMGPRPNVAQRRDAANLGNVTLFESDYQLEWMDDPWDDVDSAGAWLLELASEFSAELVHLNGYSHADLDWNIPVVVVAHSCVLSWWSAVKGGEAPHCYDEYRRRVAAGLAAADLVIAPTQAMLRSLQHIHGWSDCGRVIFNGCDADAFFPTKKQPVVFTAGRAWDEAKNISALNAIAPALRWPVVVAGSVEHPSGRRAALTNVRCLGALGREETTRRLSAASIYAMPARYEPFGLSALEAGLCECALVLGDIASLREVWQDAALFVRPDDPAALASAINRLIYDRDLREELGRCARARARQFSTGRMASRYVEAYRELIVSGAAAAESVGKPEVIFA